MRRRCCKGVKGIAMTRFTAADVVRHPLVAQASSQAYDAQQQDAHGTRPMPPTADAAHRPRNNGQPPKRER